jgi:hypothetical protein
MLAAATSPTVASAVAALDDVGDAFLNDPIDVNLPVPTLPWPIVSGLMRRDGVAWAAGQDEL